MSNVPVSWKISSRRAYISARQDRLAFRRNNQPSPIFGPVVFSLLVGYMATGNFAIHLSSSSKGCRQSPFCAALLIGFACCRHCKSWSLVFSRGKLFVVVVDDALLSINSTSIHSKNFSPPRSPPKTPTDHIFPVSYSRE